MSMDLLQRISKQILIYTNIILSQSQSLYEFFKAAWATVKSLQIKRE